MNEELTSTHDFESIKVIEEYSKRINYYKEKRKKYKLIETGKEIGESYSIQLSSCLNGYNHTSLNILSKFENLICGLDSTNLNIIEANEIWEKLHPMPLTFHNTLSNKYYITRLIKLIEYIIYDIHKFISQLFAIIWIIKYPSEKDIKIYDIGSYFNINREKNQGNEKYINIVFNEFDQYSDFLQTLNHIINANKHSPTNNESIILGKYEILATAVKMRDSLFKESKLILKPLNELITEFNDFYNYSIDLINTLTKKNKD